jgi:uncharacterized protein YdhG (YjbR/CyaY superfamily)
MERMKTKVAKTVDEYLSRLPRGQEDALEKLRKVIKEAAPKAEERISYQMPAYKYHGYIVFFAAFKSHCSLFVASRSLLSDFAEELEGYETSGGTIHFTPEEPLPKTLVKRIVKARVAENESRWKLKMAGKAKSIRRR